MARGVRAETFAAREHGVIGCMGRSSQVRRVAVAATAGSPFAEPLCLRLIFQKRGETAKYFGKSAGNCQGRRRGRCDRLVVELLDGDGVRRGGDLHCEAWILPGVEARAAVAVATSDGVGREQERGVQIKDVKTTHAQHEAE